MESTDATQFRCLNCYEALQGRFCHRCGQKHVPREQMGLRHLLADFLQNITNVNNKVFTTFKDVLLKPGVVVHCYNHGQRVKYSSPVRLLLFIFFVFFLYPMLTDFTQELDSQLKHGLFTQHGNTLIEKIIATNKLDYNALSTQFSDKQQDVAGVLVFLHVPIFAIILWLLHLNRRHLFVDHVVASAYFMVFLMLYFYAYIALIGMPVMFLAKALWGIDSAAIGQWLNLLFLKLPFFFLVFFFVKYAYAQAWWVAALKAIPLGVGFLLAHMVYRTATFYITLWLIYRNSV